VYGLNKDYSTPRIRKDAAKVGTFPSSFPSLGVERHKAQSTKEEEEKL
jgi:hypothetical protein